MDYGMIGKIEKAKLYAQEANERIRFQSLQASIAGDNDSSHDVSYNDGQWNCDCNYFATHEVCGHTMAMEKLLGQTVEMGVPVA